MPLPVVGLLPGEGGELVVLADSITVRQRVLLIWTTVTLARGALVGDIADETRDHLLRTKQIGRRNGAPYVHASRPPLAL